MSKYTVVAALAAATALGTALTGIGSARSTDSASACPSDPKTQPIGKIYGANRGSTFCNNGAKATALVGGQRLSFTGGVCWNGFNGFNVGIGTSITGKRKKSDPPGFWLQDFKPGGIVKDSVGAGKGTVTWFGPVTINRARRTFAGRAPKLVNGKLNYIRINGSYTCRKILDAPDQ